MPAVRAYHNTTQSHTTTGAWQAVVFNSERFDQAGGAASTQHDTASNTSRLTCRYAGVYQITGSLEFASNGTGQRGIELRLNAGASPIQRSQLVMAADDSIGRCGITTLYALAVNDYVELFAFQSSGGALNIAATAFTSPEFMMARVG
jgi:hypothetical protein